MSLIADALKAAQKNREAATREASTPVRPLLSGFFSAQRWERQRARRRALIVLLSSVGVVAAGLVGFVGRAPLAERSQVANEPMPEPVAPAVVDVDSSAVEPPAEEIVEEEPAPPPVTRRVAAAADVIPVPAHKESPLDTVGVEPPAPQPTRPAGSGVKMSVERSPSGNYAELFAAALAAQNRGDMVQASSLYEQLLVLRPEWAQAHSNLGAVYRAQGDLRRAESEFRRAVQLDPELAVGWSNLGMLLSAAGRHDEAIAALQQALSLNPAATGTRVNLATALHAGGSAAEARIHLEQVLGAAPTMPEAHYAMARALESLNEPARAAQSYELFLKYAAGRFPALEAQVRAHLPRLVKQ